METITIKLSSFTPMERQSIEAAAAAKNMTLTEFVSFLLSGVHTPKP